VSQEKDDLLNALGAEGDIWGDPLEALHAFLAPFEMLPDVQAQIEREFMENESFRSVILNRTDAYPRLVQTIQYGLRHRGNLIIAVDGYQRHGKSTFARWVIREIHRLRTGSADGWEEGLLYEHAYSDMTIHLQSLTKQLMEDCQGNQDAMLERLHNVKVIFDEQWIEHEKDSVKAKEDLQNIAETCAMAGIPLIFVSVRRRRRIAAYCRVWVVGIDSLRQLNLAFYYDLDGYCHGCLVTRNVPETHAYEAVKAAGVIEMFLTGGRKVAQVKAMNGSQPTVEVPFTLIVEPNADFLTILGQSARQHLLPILKEPRFVERWLHRYIACESYKDIADWETETTGQAVREESVRIYLKEQHQQHIPNTTIGAILEEALTAYLNATIPAPPPPGTVASPPTPSQQTFRRIGGPGQPDVVDAATQSVQINCKLYLEHRGTWQPDVEPEASAPHGYLVLVEAGPPTVTPSVYPLHPGRFDTGFVEKVAWDAWLTELRALTKKEVA